MQETVKITMTVLINVEVECVLDVEFEDGELLDYSVTHANQTFPVALSDVNEAIAGWSYDEFDGLEKAILSAIEDKQS